MTKRSANMMKRSSSTRSSPRSIAIWAVLLAQLGRYDEAIPHLRATLQMVPNEPAARETLDAIEASSSLRVAIPLNYCYHRSPGKGRAIRMPR